MAIWIIPESDRKGKGGQSVRSGSKVVYTMRLPQTKTRPDSGQESPLETCLYYFAHFAIFIWAFLLPPNLDTSIYYGY